MTKAATSNADLCDRIIPVLKRLETAVSCVELARLVHEDSSVIYRFCMNCPEIKHEKSHALTTFRWAGK